MTGLEFAEALEKLGWSREEAARRFGFDRRQITRFIREGASIPRAVSDWLEAAAGWIGRNPPPKGRGLPPYPSGHLGVSRSQTWDTRLGNVPGSKASPVSRVRRKI
jgi:ParB-like chromosome segregation protein Spo0J